MKTNKKKMCSLRRGIYIFTLLSMIVCLYNCNDDYKDENVERPLVPPSFDNLEFTKFYPDSGPKAEKLMLYGKGFGTDTSLIKVTVNDKPAMIMGVNDTIIYAIVPRRADTGFVKISFDRAGESPVELSSKDFSDSEGTVIPKEFNYIFRRSVTTWLGKINLPRPNDPFVAEGDGENRPSAGQERKDGNYEEARFQRPMKVMFDSDGALYVLEEGNGDNKNGSIRRVYNGTVSTLVMNSAGYFRSPVNFCFNKAQDTMFVTMDSGESSAQAPIIFLTRESGFTRVGACMTNDQAGVLRVQGIAINPVTQEMYVASREDWKIYRVDREISADGRSMSGKMVDTGITIDNGTGLGRPTSIAFSEDGKTFFALLMDSRNSIYKCNYDIATRTMTSDAGQYMVRIAGKGGWGFEPEGVGTSCGFDWPSEMIVEGTDMYITDRETARIRHLDLRTNYISVLAGPNVNDKKRGYMDGALHDAQFYMPEGIAFDEVGNIYVAERGNHLIRLIINE